MKILAFSPRWNLVSKAVGMRRIFFNMTCLSGPNQTLRNQLGWHPKHTVSQVRGLESMVYKIWIASWIERWLRCIPNAARARFSFVRTSFYRLWNLHGLRVYKTRRSKVKKSKCSDHWIPVMPIKPSGLCSSVPSVCSAAINSLPDFLVVVSMLFITMRD